MAQKITLSEYGQKEIDRRTVRGDQFIVKGNHRISLQKLTSGDQESLGLLRGDRGNSCIWTSILDVSRKPKRRNVDNSSKTID